MSRTSCSRTTTGACHYFVVDTSNWWFGKRVLIAMQAVKGVDWSDRHVRLDVSREQVKTSPPWDPMVAFNEIEKTHLHKHYGWAGIARLALSLLSLKVFVEPNCERRRAQFERKDDDLSATRAGDFNHAGHAHRSFWARRHRVTRREGAMAPRSRPKPATGAAPREGHRNKPMLDRNRGKRAPRADRPSALEQPIHVERARELGSGVEDIRLPAPMSGLQQ